MDREDRKETIVKMHKDNIASAAESLFLSKGFEKTTMDDIAKEAQYSKRTVYIYFESKDELYCHVVLKSLEQLKDNLRSALNATTDFMEQFHGFCSALLKFREGFPEQFNSIVAFQCKYINPAECMPIEKEAYESNEELYQIIYDFLKNAQDEGIVIPDIDLHRVVFILWNQMINLMTTTQTKSAYIQSQFHVTANEEFIMFGFMLLLNSILNPEE